MAAIYWYICASAASPPTVPTSGPNFQRAVINAISALSKSRRNVGDLLPRPIVKPVPLHLLCDGSEIPRTAFPQLFEEIGTEWGAGDGSTTFNVPNLLAASIPNATTAPPQTISSGGTVSTGDTVTQPSGSGQTGGTLGGNITTGGRTKPLNGLDTVSVEL